MKIKQLCLGFLSIQTYLRFDFAKLFNKHSILEFSLHCILGPGRKIRGVGKEDSKTLAGGSFLKE